MSKKSRAWKNEERKRELVMLKLNDKRAELIAIATEIAVDIARGKGRVTSPEVVQQMYYIGLGKVLKKVGCYFMGAVFRQDRWKCIGRENGGAHMRSVSIWRFK